MHGSASCFWHVCLCVCCMQTEVHCRAVVTCCACRQPTTAGGPSVCVVSTESYFLWRAVRVGGCDWSLGVVHRSTKARVHTCIVHGRAASPCSNNRGAANKNKISGCNSCCATCLSVLYEPGCRGQQNAAQVLLCWNGIETAAGCCGGLP
jgi:hypothetical protein